MGEMSTAESLLAVIGAAVGTVFGIRRIVESARGSIETSLQENDELDQRDRAPPPCGVGVVGRRASGVSRCAVVVRARFLRSFLVSAASAPVVAPRWPDGPSKKPLPAGLWGGARRVSPQPSLRLRAQRRTAPLPPRAVGGEGARESYERQRRTLPTPIAAVAADAQDARQQKLRDDRQDRHRSIPEVEHHLTVDLHVAGHSVEHELFPCPRPCRPRRPSPWSCRSSRRPRS